MYRRNMADCTDSNGNIKAIDNGEDGSMAYSTTMLVT